jgi:2,5-diketo-D-gluconate reductase A
VVIAWHLAHGFSVIPKAADPEHMSDNVAALDLTLDADDVAAIDALDRAERMGEDARAM